MENKLAIKKRKKDSPTGVQAPDKLKLLFTIVERNKTEFYLDILERFEINMQCVFFGKGTAPDHLRYLGFGDQGKAIIISVIKEEKTKKILNALEERFEKTKHGKGIAYTIPISSIIGVMIYQFLSNNQN